MIQDSLFWAFLAISVVLYWSTPLPWRQYLLALLSLGLIVYYDALSAGILLALSAALYLLLPALAARRRLGGLIASVLLLAVPLIFFKFSSVSGLLTPEGSVLRYAVPLGMSYYVFRMIHLAVETYRTETKPGFRDYVSYVFLFTIFLAGPIQRYDEFIEGRADRLDREFFLYGLMRIIVGLVKQTLLIDLLTLARNGLLHSDPARILTRLHSYDAGQLWTLAIATYLISYLNLSAYTDIAIGSSRLFGLKITENFNYPVAASSLTDFWRRWHMSLSNWCQTYIFAPVLGLTRNPYVALVASFQVMGLWHLFTVNRMAWGLYQALGLSVLSFFRGRGRTRKRGEKLPRWRVAVNWIVTQAYVAAGFLLVVVERDNNVVESARLLTKTFTFGLVG